MPSDPGHGTLTPMSVSRWGSVAALLGGLAWVVSAVLGWGEDPEQVSYLVGLALLVVALAAALPAPAADVNRFLSSW